MKLYLLKLKGPTPCSGCVEGFVVAAVSPVHARELAHKSGGNEGNVWLDVNSTSCQVLGEAARSVKPGVVMRDWYA